MLCQFQKCQNEGALDLWASSGAANSAQLRADLKHHVESIVFTEDESDGTLRKDSAMYAAYAAKENRISAHCVAVYGSSSSIRPELTAIAMAYEDVRREEDLTILTDSLSCLVLLKSLQWRDFPLWISASATAALGAHCPCYKCARGSGRSKKIHSSQVIPRGTAEAVYFTHTVTKKSGTRNHGTNWSK